MVKRLSRRFRKAPNLCHLKVFDCKAFAFVEKQKRKRFNSRAEEGILLGYSNISKTYLIGRYENGFLEISYSRNVKFNERVFPGPEIFHGRNFEQVENIVFEIDERESDIAEKPEC